MVKKEQSIDGYVKKETLMLVAGCTLVIGFIIGGVFGIYMSGNIPGVPVQQPHQHTAAGEISDGRLDAEIMALEKDASQHPDKAESWIKLGNIYFDTNRFKESIQAYEKALKIDPQNANVLTDLGVMYRRAGNPEKAVEAFDRAIAVNSGHEIARFNKGIVLMHDLKDSAGAMKAWNELLAINPAAAAPNGMPVKDMLERMAVSSGKTDP